MTSAPEAHKTAGVLATLREANRVRQAEWCAGGDPEPDLSFRAVELAGEVGEACNVVKKLERERHGWRGSRATFDQLAEELADVVICTDLLAMTVGIDLEAAVVAKFNATSEKVGLATRLGRPLTVEEDADLLEAEWSGSDASVSRVTNRILASRSTPSVPSVAELSTAGHIERIAEAMWRAEVSDLRAAHNARQSTSLSEQSDQMREKWMRLACAAVSAFPAVAELSGDGLARGVAGAAEGNLLTAAKKALAFYDGLDREHDPGEAAVLDALDTAVRAALTASPAGDDPKALDAAARSSSTEAVEQEVERLRCGLEGAREAIAVAMADLSAKGWHHSERPCQTLTDASIAIRKLLARPSPAPAACKPEGETHG